MAYKNLKLVLNKKKYKTLYWVILPHWTRGDLQPKIRRYKPDIDKRVNGKYMKCWNGYDYVQGSFKTYKEAREHVNKENDFRRSKGWLKEKGKPYKTIFQIGKEIKQLEKEINEKLSREVKTNELIIEIMEINYKIIDLCKEHSNQMNGTPNK